jgi:hypothetical protein
MIHKVFIRYVLPVVSNKDEYIHLYCCVGAVSEYDITLEEA